MAPDRPPWLQDGLHGCRMTFQTSRVSLHISKVKYRGFIVSLYSSRMSLFSLRLSLNDSSVILYLLRELAQLQVSLPLGKRRNSEFCTWNNAVFGEIPPFGFPWNSAEFNANSDGSSEVRK
jgi:hypothetical protein